MNRQIIHTERAPQALGTYSQAVRAGDTVYLSGQVPLDPATTQLVSGDFEAQVRRVFENLKAVAEAAGGSLAQAVKVNIETPAGNPAAVEILVAMVATCAARHAEGPDVAQSFVISFPRLQRPRRKRGRRADPFPSPE